MKRKLTVVVTLVLFAQVCLAQLPSKKVEVTWGPKHKDLKGKGAIVDIVGFDDSNVYMFREKSVANFFASGPNITLESYDKDMKLVKSVKLDLKQEGRDRSLERILYLDDKIYLFTTFKNQRVRKHYLFVETIDKKTLLPKDDLTKIAEVSYSQSSKSNSGNFNFEMSKDESKLLVYFNLPYRKRKNEKYGFHVFDNNMNQLWQKQVTLPYTDELFSVDDYEVSNDGDVYLLGRVFTKNPNRTRLTIGKEPKPDYSYTILSYLNKGSEEKQYSLNGNEHFLVDMQIIINDDQDIICAGFYSDENEISVKGSYFMTVDGESKEIKEKNFNEFSFDFITENTSKKNQKKAKRKNSKGKNVELQMYSLDRIIEKEDGGVVLIGEQAGVSTYRLTNQNGSTGSLRYNYRFNDIIVINLAPDGTMEWSKRIAKRQSGGTGGGIFLSYALSVVRDKLYFIFNDDSENLFYKGEGKIAPYSLQKRGIVSLVELDSEGNQDRELLYVSKDKKLAARPGMCLQIADNELLYVGQWKQTGGFAKITFKK